MSDDNNCTYTAQGKFMCREAFTNSGPTFKYHFPTLNATIPSSPTFENPTHVFENPTPMFENPTPAFENPTPMFENPTYPSSFELPSTFSPFSSIAPSHPRLSNPRLSKILVDELKPCQNATCKSSDPHDCTIGYLTTVANDPGLLADVATDQFSPNDRVCLYNNVIVGTADNSNIRAPMCRACI